MDKDSLEYVNVPNYSKEITEYCPHCENEVELQCIFANQVCPNCGELITPCGLCDHNVCDCENCPLQKTLFKKV